MPQTIICQAGQKKGPFSVSPGCQVTAFTTAGGAGTLTYADEQVLRQTSAFTAWPTSITSVQFSDIAVKPMQLIMGCSSGTMTLLISDPDARNLLPQTDWMSQSTSLPAYFAALLDVNGYVADGVNDDSTAVQNALTAFFNAYPAQTALFPPTVNGTAASTSKWLSGVSIDLGKMGIIDFNGLKIDFSGATDGLVAFTMTTSTTNQGNVDPLIKQGMRGVKNLWIAGNGEGNTQIAFQWVGVNITCGASHGMMENIFISDFGTGIQSVGPSVYLNRWSDIRHNNVGTCYDIQNATNSGENVMIYRAVIGNSGTGFKVSGSTMDVNVIGGSFDFSGELFNVTTARLRFVNYHYEGTNVGSWGTTTGNQTMVTMTDCELIKQSGGTDPAAYFNVGANTYLRFVNCAMQGFRNTAVSYLCTGAGYVESNGMQTINISSMCPSIIDTIYNFANDPTFSSGGTTGTFDVIITGSTSWSTRMANTTGSFAVVTSNPNSTNQSLMFFRSGTNAFLNIYGVIPTGGQGKLFGAKVNFFGSSSFSSGTMTYNWNFRRFGLTGADGSGFNGPINSTTFADVAGFLPSTSGTLKITQPGYQTNSLGKVPMWATHFGLQIKGSAMPSSSNLFIEGLEFTTW